MNRLRIHRAGAKLRRAFTLLEVLLALSLASILMASTTFFIFSMAELWGGGSEERVFERHARGVTRFLQNSFQQSLAARDPAMPGRVSLLRTPGQGSFEEPLIAFELMESPGFLVWPDQRLPNVVCYLKLVENEGLFLLWHSRLELGFEEEEPRATLLTPFVTAMAYDYYDFENGLWSHEAMLRTGEDGEYELPTRLRLTFEYDGFSLETVLVLPRQNVSVALF